MWCNNSHPLHAGHKYLQDLHIGRIDQGPAKHSKHSKICMEVFEDGYKKKHLKHLMTLKQLMATKDVEEKLLLATRLPAAKMRIPRNETVFFSPHKLLAKLSCEHPPCHGVR
jgi:hypothetical protein